MFRLGIFAFLVPCLSLSLSGAPVPKEKLIFVDIQPYGNHKLDERMHSDREHNHLKSLPRGEQKFKNVTFKVGDKMMQLGSKLVEKYPDKIEGIKVDAKAAKIHALHACAYGGGPNTKGTDGHEEEDVQVGEYRLTYEDGATESLPVLHGRDVRDWWFAEDERDTSKAVVVWKGENDASKEYGMKLRLYQSTWENPRPDQKIVKIDFIGRKDKTPCAPFCLGITLEEK